MRLRRFTTEAAQSDYFQFFKTLILYRLTEGLGRKPGQTAARTRTPLLPTASAASRARHRPAIPGGGSSPLPNSRGATAKGYTHRRDEDDTAVRGASHRGAAPRGDGLTRGETPARASLSRPPNCVRLSRGQKHRPGGTAGGRGCAGAGLPAPAGRRSARDVGVVLPQRANPGYLTRRAAGAEHHLNPRRERARPPGACRAAACRPCPAATSGSPTVWLCAPAAAQPRIRCPQGHAVPRLHGGGQVHAPVTCGEPAKAQERGAQPLRPRRPPERARPRLAAPRRERSNAAPAAALLPGLSASREESRPEPPPRLPPRRGADTAAGRGPGRGARKPDAARSFARRAHKVPALPALPTAGRPRRAAPALRPREEGGRGGGGESAIRPPRGRSHRRRRRSPGPARLLSPARTGQRRARRRAPAPQSNRYRSRAPPGRAGRGGAERSDPPASRLRPPAAVTHLPAPAAPSSPGAAAAGPRRLPRRLRSAGHVTGPLCRPRKGGLDVRSLQWGRWRRGPGRHGARGGGAPRRCPPAAAAATGGREADALVSMTSAGGAAAFDGARRASGVGDFATSGSRGAGRGRGEAGPGVASLRPWVASRRQRGRGPPRRGGDPPAAGEAAVPRGRGGHRPDRGASVALVGGGRARCRSRPGGGGGAVAGGALRDRRVPGARSSPAPGGAGAPCRAVPCRAVPCPPGQGRCRPTASPSREQPVGAALAAPEQRARGARRSLGEAPFCLPGCAAAGGPCCVGPLAGPEGQEPACRSLPAVGIRELRIQPPVRRVCLSGNPGSSPRRTGNV
ncbi:collagen alpha-1(I) chain-like [Pyrgilauda ruficollis]|uniref:collagen alpha-1(I) chain-like n=1 Tax=Pyrgilauda ruficollis TaxID=221976 RepID=UPI001B881346|nr:collagen alpha-1(I) chain-like [Pyrgilauda ruficollis]